MSWADWLGGAKAAAPAAEEPPGPEVASCARTPLPKVRARGGAARPAPTGYNDHVPASDQVSKIVVDYADMCAPTIEPVLIHIYDLGPQVVSYFKDRQLSYNPYYTGVEVCSSEYSFGLSISTLVAEIHSNEPRKNMEHKFRMTIAAGYTSVPPREVLRAVEEMKDELWNNNTFNWRSRNCHHFTDALCGKLGTRMRAPQWLHEDVGASQRVFLRVYNLGQTFITRWHNTVNKSYGAYHTGVEVYGKEWAFGVPGDYGCSAVGWCPPGECPEHDPRDCLFMGTSTLSPKQIEAIIEEMRCDWTGDKYDMFTNNCHNFSKALCGKLGVAQPPSWINDLAEYLAKDDARTPSKDHPSHSR